MDSDLVRVLVPPGKRSASQGVGFESSAIRQEDNMSYIGIWKWALFEPQTDKRIARSLMLIVCHVSLLFALVLIGSVIF